MTALTPTYDRTADRITLGVLIAIIVAGLTTIAGWHFHLNSIIQIVPGSVAMTYTTALCFVILGISGCLIIRNPGCRPLLMIAGCFIALIGLLTIIEFLSGNSLGIDTVFFKPWDTTL